MPAAAIQSSHVPELEKPPATGAMAACVVFCGVALAATFVGSGGTYLTAHWPLSARTISPSAQAGQVDRSAALKTTTSGAGASTGCSSTIGGAVSSIAATVAGCSGSITIVVGAGSAANATRLTVVSSPLRANINALMVNTPY